MHYHDKLGMAIPMVQKCHGICRNGMVKTMAKLLYRRCYEEKGIKVPYMDEVLEYLVNNINRIPKRILLVTDSESVAIKAAAYMREHFQDYSFDDYDELYDDIFYEDYEENEDDANALRVVSMRQQVLQDRTIVGNAYVHRMHEVEENEMVLFTDLSGEEDIADKLEAIVACPCAVQLVHIRRDQLQCAWLQAFLMDYGADVVQLSGLTLDYTETVLNYLLEGEAFQLDPSIETRILARKMIKRRGRHFQEEDIAWHLDKAMESAMKNHPRSKVLRESDFVGLNLGEKKPMELLQELIGIGNVKIIAQEMRALVREEIKNKKLGTLYKSMLFSGNPGTGKSTCARILADIMAEEGESNAVFVEATRKDIIGEYVGHTAPMVAKCFEQARGGILFVDEAGFFLNRQAGEFVMEAIKEFVRYMELYPDVTVIFAMYPQEAKSFLELDDGLSSRIGRVVHFEDYSNEELCEIATQMFEKRGYTLVQEAHVHISDFMDAMRKEQKKKFGNAREVRKLVESTIIATSLLNYQQKDFQNSITAQEILEGQKRLQQETLVIRTVFGFNNKQVQ